MQARRQSVEVTRSAFWWADRACQARLQGRGTAGSGSAVGARGYSRTQAKAVRLQRLGVDKMGTAEERIRGRRPRLQPDAG